MTKVKEEVKSEAYYKDIYFFYEMFSSLKTLEEIKPLVKDLFTKSELRMLKRRWHIATLIMEGMDIRTVADKSKASTQTVEKIKHILEDGEGGLYLAITRMEEKQRQEKRKIIDNKKSSKFVKSFIE